MNNKKIILGIFTILILSLTSASTFPGIPHQFYGKVIINNAVANTGTVIAKIDNQSVGNTKITLGRYGYNPLFFIEDPNYNLNGKTIMFYANGFYAGNYTFENGATTRFDLIVGNYTGFCGDSIQGENEDCDWGSLNGKRCDNSEEDCTYCSSSCKLVILHEEQEDHETSSRRTELLSTCSTNWECTNWGECQDGVMKRICNDLNQCEFSYDKPIESTACDLSPSKINLEPGNNKSSLLWLWVIIALIIIIILVIIINRR